VSRKGSSRLAIRLQDHGPLAVGVCIGGLGGLVFAWLGAPVPWMLGALAFTSIAAMAGVRIVMPRGVRNAFIPALAVGLGGFLDTTALTNPPLLLLLVLLVVLYMAVTIGLGFLFFHRIVGYDRATSCFAAVPGGLTEILIVAETARADLKVIALVHTARLVVAVPVITLTLRAFYEIDALTAAAPAAMLTWSDVAVLTVCAVVGYLGGLRIGLPAPQVFGPLTLSAIAYGFNLAEGAPPAVLIGFAQVLVGVFIGARFTGVRIGQVYPILLWSVGWAAVLLVLVAGLAVAVAAWLSESAGTLLLAFAPGGVAEISLLALASGATLSLVMSVQFLRLASTILFGALVGWVIGRTDRRSGKEDRR
jgi:uncharacterized protein